MAVFPVKRMDPRNTGHGHVFKRPDGVVMRCGGPGLCKECALDFVKKHGSESDEQLLADVKKNGT